MQGEVLKIKRWISRAKSSPAAELISKELRVSSVMAQIMVNRGIENPELAQAFLNPQLSALPNPFLMKDMDKAVLCMEEALRNKRKTVIYGDYDVDGTTGSSLMYLFLRELGMEVDVYIPHRVQEGYGLNLKALEHLKSENYDLVVTVDNGISSVEEAQRAREIGLDLVIIDHHQVPPQIPFARAILNPKQIACEYPFKELAAVGVVFQFCLAFRNHLRKQGFFATRPEPHLKKYLDLVVLGTIADMVPLKGLNRILVKEGLEVLSHSKNIGIQALKEVAGIEGDVSPGQVGFRLGPRINAVGRLDSAKLGFELLTTTQPAQAKALAQKLDVANRERQDLQASIFEEACVKLDQDHLLEGKKSILVFDSAWHVGVIGIVASKLVERYHLPALVGTQEGDSVRCSARSIPGLNIYDALTESSAFLKKFGGHKQAAGLHFELQHQEDFWKSFDQAVRKQLSSEEDFLPQMSFDAELKPSQIQDSLIEELQRLEPFGQGNAEPVFWSPQYRLKSQKIVGEKHLKLVLEAENRVFDAIGFRMDALQVPNNANLECLFTCEMNEWMGRKKIQLRLLDSPRNLLF